MNQSSQPRATVDRSHGAHTAELAIGRMELKSAVRSLIVVMVDVLVQHPLEVRSAANDQPVQAFATNTSHPALGEGVGLRSLTPSPASTCSNANGNFLSTSQIMNLAWEPCSRSSQVRFRACWLTHPWFGLSVAPNYKMRRVPSSIKKRT